MHEQNLDHAVDVLRERVGTRFNSTEIDGRGELVRALSAGLNIDSSEAERMLAALIENGKLRYRRDSEAHSDDVVAGNAGVVGGVVGAVPTPGINSSIGVPIIPTGMGGGFWELTDANSTVKPSTTRKGQVEPSGI
jgi:hypothetical protein